MQTAGPRAHPAEPKHGLAPLGIGAVCGGMALVYLAFAGFYRGNDEPFNASIRLVFQCASVLALLWLYWQGYRQLRAGEGNAVGLLIGGAALFALITLLIEPFHSRDILGYVNRGWQQVHYGLNPYVSVISDIPHWRYDPMLFDHWVSNPCPYGFLFAQLAKILCYLGGGNLTATVLLFKFTNILAHGAIGWLLWLGSKRLHLPRPDLVLYLYLWNPLILLQHLANGHNDILMGLLLTLGAYLVLIEAWLWVIPALVGATLVKYTAGVAVPLTLLFILRQRGWRPAFTSALLGGVVLLLLGWPYLADWAQFPLGAIGANATVSTNSLHAMVQELYEEVVHWLPGVSGMHEVVNQGLKQALWVGFFAMMAWQLVRAVRAPQYSVSTWIADVLLLQVALVCVVSSKFYPWYLGMFFPLALLLPREHGLRRLVLLLSGFQLLAFTFLGKAHIANYLVMTVVPVVWVLWLRRKAAHAP